LIFCAIATVEDNSKAPKVKKYFFINENDKKVTQR